MHQCAKEAATRLENCYNLLRADNWEPSILQEESTRFCLLYGALEQHSAGQNLWKVKPKFHMWLELCMGLSNPSKQWVYREEDFGGSVAQMSRRRGGKNSVFSTGDSVLNNFDQAMTRS